MTTSQKLVRSSCHACLSDQDGRMQKAKIIIKLINLINLPPKEKLISKAAHSRKSSMRQSMLPIELLSKQRLAHVRVHN